MAVSGLQTSPEGRKLWNYWVHGEGAADIGWGAPDDYARCLVEVGQHVDPAAVHGECANMHIAATGMTTTEHAKLLGKDSHRHGTPMDHLKATVHDRGR